jgi:hypothetical protein
MKLWLISQNDNDGYDTYDSAVVAAETEEEACSIHPSGYEYDPERSGWYTVDRNGNKVFGAYDTWTNTAESVKVQYVGEAKEGIQRGVICASFNAG